VAAWAPSWVYTGPIRETAHL
jgi:hypothetical protein